MHQTADPQLEEVILSHCFAEQTLIEHPKLKPELFTLPRHLSLFEQMKKLRLQGDAITADAIKLEQPELEDAAKKLSLRRLGDVTSKTVIRKLCEMHRRRTMQDVAAHLNEAAVTADDPDAVMSEQLSRLMAEEGDGEVTERSIGDIGELVEILEWKAANPGKIRGIPTGFAQLDRLIDGLHPGVTALCGRTSDGKSSLGMNITLNVAKYLQIVSSKKCIYYGSYEMNFIDMQLRLAASMSGYELSEGGLTVAQSKMLHEAVSQLRGLPIVMDDKAHPDINYVVNRLRKLHREKGLALAVLDYIQLVRNPKSKGNTVQDLDLVSKTIQGLSRELDIPILAIVMLRRPEKQFDKKTGRMIIPPPHTSDIKGTGSIEEDSQTVLLIYRDPDDNSRLLVGKNRRGPRDREIEMAYAASIYRFAEK